MNEMLWFARPDSERRTNGYRLRRDGVWEYCLAGGNEWSEITSDHPIYEELARRLLAERVEREKLDDHNDELEGRATVRADLDRRLEELDKNLAREIEQRIRNCATYKRVQADLIAKVEGLEASKAPREQVEAMWEVLYNNFYHPVAPWGDGRRVVGALHILRQLDQAPDRPGQAAAPEPPPALSWDRAQGIMVDAFDRIVLDLSDYFEDGKMSPKDHDLLEKLAELWCAWGERGYLRERLYGAAGNSDAFRYENFEGWFRQLRSELLAKPWKEGV